MTDEAPKKQRMRVTTPLVVIASFVTLTEAVVTLAITKADGTIQLILTLFAVLFPIGVGAAFFSILWNRPYVLYPPTEYGTGTDVEKYVGALRPPTTLTPGAPIQPTVEANQTITEAAVVEVLATDAVPIEPEEPWFTLYKNKEYDLAATRLLEQAEQDGIDQGLAYALAGRMKLDKDRLEGLAFFEKAFIDVPVETEPYIWLANAYAGWDQISAAIQTIDRGVAAGADMTALTIAKARLLSAKGRKAEAIALLKTELERKRDARPLLALAEIHSSEGSTEAAIAAYQDALEIDPISEVALSELANLKAASSDRAGALALYHRLIGVKPQVAAYRALMGNIYLELELISKALDSYERANGLAESKEGWILGNIGNILKNRGFHHKAVDYLQQALVIDPRSTYLHDRLAGALKGITAEDEKEAALLRPHEQEVQKSLSS